MLLGYGRFGVMSFVAFGHRPVGTACREGMGVFDLAVHLFEQLAAVEPKHGFTLDSPDEATLAEPKGHVDHMALRSVAACTTQRRTFVAATPTGAN